MEANKTQWLRWFRIPPGTLVLAAIVPTLAAGQLPPEIEMDRFLLIAERAVESGDSTWARAAMEEILALQEEHGVEPAPEDLFRHATVWLAAGEPRQARHAITRYLELLGPNAANYGEALDLRNHAEADITFGAFRKDPVGPAGMEFVWVPPGEFRMGSTSSEAHADEWPVTRVRISRGFWLGKYEVTQSEWVAVMGFIASWFSGCGRCPVEDVSWEAAQEFIGRLNRQEGREVFRLPTEAEWEYAARAGTAGDRYGNLDTIAQHSGGFESRPQPVGGKAPNAWGLHDMLGNVSEWVQDWYGGYPGGTVTDPRGPESGSDRVIRGGSWGGVAGFVRAPVRSRHPPDFRFPSLGFRLLRTAS